MISSIVPMRNDVKLFQILQQRLESSDIRPKIKIGHINLLPTRLLVPALPGDPLELLIQKSLLIKIKCTLKNTLFDANLIRLCSILVYPQGVPGAVNITNGDLARLKPGEYLNDTLIEFGLKRVYYFILSAMVLIYHRLWLKDLETKQPELAAQVHIFNSFFYKKLNNKKKYVTELFSYEDTFLWLHLPN